VAGNGLRPSQFESSRRHLISCVIFFILSLPVYGILTQSISPLSSHSLLPFLQYFNIIFPNTSTSPKTLPPLRSSTKHFHASHLLHACYVSVHSHLFLLTPLHIWTQNFSVTHLCKVKVTPQQAEVAQGVPGRLKPRIFLTFRHYKGGRSSAKRTGRLYPMRNPWYSLSEAESTTGHMVLSEVPRKKSPTTPPSD